MTSVQGALASVMSSSNLDADDIFHLLESSDLSVQEETMSLVKDNLGSVSEPWLLQGLVEFYMKSGNSLARELLCVVRQQQHKALMNKIDEYLQKVGTRLKALTLLGHIIRSEPIWTHCIINTKSFQTVLKCLQVDTDLPTVTSALYVIVTLLPKVASQISASLPTMCAIFVRLVSWNSIKPAGASEVNLMHLHTAVYALFLCLYGMYPCYFIKYLQQCFQSFGGNSGKGGNPTEKEKARVFENSVLPMLDHVRLHPHLVTESSNIEMSSEKWRKLESQDIIADISKVTLDSTENSNAKSVDCNVKKQTDIEQTPPTMKLKLFQHQSSTDCDQLLPTSSSQQEYIWSPSVAIGLSTPPQSRGISPTPFLQPPETSDVSATQEDSPNSKQSNRPVTLGVNTSDAFMPNRPHQTSSSTSTPLKQNFPPLSTNTAQSPLHTSPNPPRTRTKSDGKESFVVIGTECTSPESLQENLNHGTELNKKDSESCFEASEVCVIDSNDQISPNEAKPAENPSREADCSTEFTPGLQAYQGGSAEDGQNPTEECENDNLTSARALIDLSPSDKYIEKSPNQLLDLHVQLLAESYAKNARNRDLEWHSFEGKNGHEGSYLRNQVLQIHCAMLYERHRREQHSIRARKLMRKVYDTAALEARNKTLMMQVQNLEKESENFGFVEKTYRDKIKALEKGHKVELESVYSQLNEQREKIGKLETTYTHLSSDKELLTNECEKLKSENTRLRSRVFTLEQLGGMSEEDHQKLRKLETKTAQLKADLVKSTQGNSQLEHMVKEARGGAAAQVAEAKMTSDAYARQLAATEAKHKLDKAQLDLVQKKALEFESELQKKELLLSEQKKYLENVKSLARGQIKAIGSKYSAQKQISQRLEIQVLELFSRLTAIEGEMAIRERTHLTSGPRSIQSLSAFKASNDFEQIMSSSPQLSPPVRGGMDLLASERKLAQNE
uniref:Hamartin n=1 Tax=Phallusia mammillata TaxID=59560 RepID=A0A6F9DWB0_9ASCI|nr:hamartin [Phallusia mammillata]